MTENIKALTLGPLATVRQALQVLEDSHREIVLIADEGGRLLGTVTDGDVRRGTLAGLSTEETVERVMHRHPTVGQPGMRRSEMLQLMNRRGVEQLPLVDDEGRVVNISFLTELVEVKRLAAKAVIMAGGNGTRLRPLTYDVPKPLLPVADKPILEMIVEQLIDAGIEAIFVITHYKAEMIEDHFRGIPHCDGLVHFVREEEPLGTAGGLRLISDELTAPCIVMNADVLTRLNFAKFVATHIDGGSAMTIGVKRQELQIPYGVVEADATGRVRNIAEKPVYPFNLNIGIYALSPESVGHLPEAGAADITDLIRILLQQGEIVSEYLINDYWVDIGRIADYEKACEDVLNNRF